MRRTLIVMSIVGVTMFVARPASAVIVECANCSTIYEELISDARQVQQLATQLDSYRTQLQQYANMVTNTISLPEEVFSPVINDINQVRNIANAASLLTGGSGSIMTRLQSISGYASMAATMPGNFPNQLVMWNQTLGNAQRSLGSVLGIQQGQQVTYAAQQAAIQNQLQFTLGMGAEAVLKRHAADGQRVAADGLIFMRLAPALRRFAGVEFVEPDGRGVRRKNAGEEQRHRGRRD